MQTFSGVVEIQNSTSGTPSITLDGDKPQIKVSVGNILWFSVSTGAVGGAVMTIGSKDVPGFAVISGPSGTSITLDGSKGDLIAGGAGQPGTLILRQGEGKNTIGLEGSTANIGAGGNGQAGTLILRQGDGKPTIHLEGSPAFLAMGTAGQPGTLMLRDNTGADSIVLNGSEGDIVLRNADCAEEFDVAEEVEAGTVMVLDALDACLRPSTTAYDRRVAGVVSGVGGYRAGIVFDRQPGTKNRRAVALAGKVYCKVDARNGAIEIGDLLTTSSTPGHAMTTRDPIKAFGAVIGKALQPFAEGTGLIPILVGLQ
jgi:hypothetical protein